MFSPFPWPPLKIAIAFGFSFRYLYAALILPFKNMPGLSPFTIQPKTIATLLFSLLSKLDDNILLQALCKAKI